MRLRQAIFTFLSFFCSAKHERLKRRRCSEMMKALMGCDGGIDAAA
jgi:hypothetical protein